MKTIFGDWPRAANGTLTLQLSKYALIAGTTDNAPRFHRIRLDSQGAIPDGSQMWANDQLMPEGSLYQATITDTSGFIVAGPQMISVCGPDPIDLNQVLAFRSATVTPPPVTPITVTITPGSGSLHPDDTLQFTATVTGTANQGVTWCTSNGSIDANGLYTAPSPEDVPAATQVTVMAISVAEPGRSAKVIIALNPAAPVITVTVAPAAVTMNASATQQFSATVTNTANVAVIWSASQGSITTAGLFTAPPAAAVTSVTITATSQADPTKSAHALVTVDPLPVIVVTVSPSTVTLTAGQTQQFHASLTNTTNQSVTWSVTPATGAGTISTAGLYTAPATVSATTSVTITATSVADTTRKGQVTITINPAATISVTISPTSATLTSGKTQQFTAAVTNTTNTAVTWTTTAGSITTAGLFTAQSVTAQTKVTVTVTSQADTTKKASATVTVNPVVSVAVTPTSGQVQSGHTMQFSATVSGSTNQTVTWTVSPTTAGTISTAGLFTAGTVSAATTVTITATSAADTTKHATASITVQPPTPAQLDLVQWWLQSTRATQHLVGDPNAPYAVTYLDTDAGYPSNYPKNCIWHIKNKLGNPWDVQKYDANYISHWITENGDAVDKPACQAANGTSCWLYAKAYKRKLTPQHLMPRHFTPGSTITLDTQAPNAGNRTTNCEATFTVVNLGPSRCITTGPFKISWGGSIDKGSGTLANGPNYDATHGVDTIKNSYQFTGSFAGGFADVEETYYVLGFGRVAWYYYKNGVFVQKTVNTTLASGGHPVPNFPCGVGKSWFV